MHKINYQQESENIIKWIRKVFKESVQKKIVIGLSGGIDSTVSCALATEAIGKENVIPVLLPYSSLSSEGVEDAHLVIDYLGIAKDQVVTGDIKEGVDGVLTGLRPFAEYSPLVGPRSARFQTEPGSARNDVLLRRGNIMARVRMIYLFDLAKQHKALVCGTENKSEHYLGYFTRFGDEASDIEPIRHLYKTHVWEMGKYLGLPEKIITKAPTAGLWDGQTDEAEMGFSYKDADNVLYYFIDEKLSEEEIIKKGIAKNIVHKVLERVKKNEFKHQLPFIYE